MNKGRGRDLFAKYRPLLNAGAKFYGIFPRSIRMKLWNHIIDKKGVFRIAQRYMLLKTLASNVGENVSIHDHVYLFHIENMSFGNNVSIHEMCYFQASGGVKIGNDVSIAHGVTLMTEAHQYDDMEVPIKDQPIRSEPIKLGNDVWIGAKAIILNGLTIGSGSIVGAGAVVTKDVRENSVVAGVPAKEIKHRGELPNE